MPPLRLPDDSRLQDLSDVNNDSIGDGRVPTWSAEQEKFVFTVPAAGSGDMTKATYDPNEDGIIALAQLDTGISTFKQADHDGLPNPHHSNAEDHSHANKATLDTYNQTEADLSDAVTKKHSNVLDHSNSNDLTAEQKAGLTEGGETALHSHAGGGGQAFPVGSVFLAVVATDPATLLGYGTWSQIAQGQFLVGQNGADVDFDVAEEVGGAKTHTHAAHPEYSHAQDTASPKWWDTAGGDSKPDAHPSRSHDSPSHLPPYFVIYAWKRTA